MTSMIFFRVLPLLPFLTLAIPVAAPAEDPAVVKVLSLLEENDLGNWKTAPFAFDGDVGVRDGILTVRQGAYLCGVVWKKEPPARMNYEIELDARYTLGSDFFLGLTVPVGDTTAPGSAADGEGVWWDCPISITGRPTRTKPPVTGASKKTAGIASRSASPKDVFSAGSKVKA